MPIVAGFVVKSKPKRSCFRPSEYALTGVRELLIKSVQWENAVLMKFLIACCACLALFFSYPLGAQYMRVGVQGQIPIGKLGEMEDMLRLADASQKVDLLTRLGVDLTVAHTIVEELRPDEKIDLQVVSTPDTTHYGVALLPGFRGCFLYLLQGEDEDTQHYPWHVIDRQFLDCWHGDSVLEFLPLRHADADDIVAHHVNYGHGSNYVKIRLRYFRSWPANLFRQWSRRICSRETHWESILRSLRSIEAHFCGFRIAPLEETRTTTVKNKLENVERRYWRWSEQKHRFIPSQFMPVVVPNP